jgi:DNA-binding MarR family transcriptional regulator
MPRDSAITEPAGPVDELNSVDALVQLSFLVQSVLTRVGAAHDLSISQLRLLGIVRDRDAGMMELAEHLGLDKSSVTGLIDRAEKRSLVQRSRIPGDGRALRVSMTAHGLALAETVTAAVQTAIAALTGVLTTDQQAQLSALAGAIVGAQPTPLTDSRKPGMQK